MKQGEKRPRAWSSAAPTGRMSEQGLRSQLASITAALRDRSLSHRLKLRYLDHAAELRRELQAVVREKLTARLKELQAIMTDSVHKKVNWISR